MQIASLVNDRIMPNMKTDFVGSNDSINGAAFNEGFIAALNNDSTLFTQKAASKMYNDLRTSIRDSKNAVYKKENEDWLKTNANKEGMKSTASGLQYKVLVAGKGVTPKATDKVTVKYEGRMIDGTVFDSSYKRNPQTTSFHCNEVIKGWTEALTMMPVGSKWEICIPQELAYGSRQAGQIKPYSTLVFTVELISIDK
jgi:FKBP-type peptidyl-prolyl cis-trans isomerase FklB